MNVNGAFRQVLIDLDVRKARELWHEFAPHLPQPADDHETLVTLHAARAQMRTLPEKLRKYSEDWLAERRNGVVASAVGIAVHATKARRQAEALERRAEAESEVTSALREGLTLDDPTDVREIKRRVVGVLTGA